MNAVVKQGESIKEGDWILAEGAVRQVTEVYRYVHEPEKVRVWCGSWGAWYGLKELVAVVDMRDESKKGGGNGSEEAEDFAMEIIEEPSLCHQCTRACGDLHYDETTVELIEDDNQ